MSLPLESIESLRREWLRLLREKYPEYEWHYGDEGLFVAHPTKKDE